MKKKIIGRLLAFILSGSILVSEMEMTVWAGEIPAETEENAEISSELEMDEDVNTPSESKYGKDSETSTEEKEEIDVPQEKENDGEIPEGKEENPDIPAEPDEDGDRGRLPVPNQMMNLKMSLISLPKIFRRKIPGKCRREN